MHGRTVFLHNLEELDHHLRYRPDEHLPLAALLGVVDGAQAVIQYANSDHVA